MSRVFEALTKSGREKRKAEPKSTDQPWVLEEKAPTGNGSPRAAEHPAPAAPQLRQDEPRPRSWREKVEELLFGRDLRRYASHPIVALEKESPAAEQYKILREQVKRLRGEMKARSLAVTSPLKEDGKTMVAVNLAAAIALDYEQKVILIDGDLRNPKVHHYFGVRSSPGLADYLSSGSRGDLAQYVQETFLPGLRIFPAGSPSELPSELLSQLKMRNLMEEIHSQFPGYQVIVDTPPVLLTPDPLVLAHKVDAIIVVVRAGRTPRDYLTKAIQSLNSDKVMGVVLNGAELGINSRYYYYYRDQEA